MPSLVSWTETSKPQNSRRQAVFKVRFFVRLVFMSTSKYLDRKKHGTSPLTLNGPPSQGMRKDVVVVVVDGKLIYHSPEVVIPMNLFLSCKSYE